MLFKMKGVLRNIIGRENVDSMSTSRAKKVVADFYMAVELATLGCRNQQAVDYCSTVALQEAGLGMFVS